MAVSQKMDIAKKKVMTPEFRVSFPAVFKPKSYKGQEPKYSIVMLFDKKTDISAIRTAVMNAAIEQFGEDKTRWPMRTVNGRREYAFKLPWRDGADREDTEGYGPGVIFMSASSKTQPGLVNGRLERIIDESEFYPGCWARATLIAFWYDTSGNKGVGLSLQNIQKTKDDKSFSGRKAAEDEFTSVDDSSDDPAAYVGSMGSDLEFDMGV